MSQIVEFNCPHCGNELAGDSSQDGETHSCPHCNGLVTLQVASLKQVVGATLLTAGLAIAAAIFGGGE